MRNQEPESRSQEGVGSGMSSPVSTQQVIEQMLLGKWVIVKAASLQSYDAGAASLGALSGFHGFVLKWECSRAVIWISQRPRI
jgi:hypothetical protein